MIKSGAVLILHPYSRHRQTPSVQIKSQPAPIREPQPSSSWTFIFGEIQNTRIKKSTLLYVVMSMGLSVHLYGLFNRFFTASSIFSNLKPLTTSSMRACILSLQRLPMEPSWVWWMFLLGVKLPASMSSPTFL